MTKIKSTKRFWGNQHVTIGKVGDSLKKLVKGYVTILSIAALAYTLIVIGGYLLPREVLTAKTIDVSATAFEARISEIKGKVIDQLVACESGGYKEADGLIIFDSNKVASLGVLQWQVKSVQYYYKMKTGEEISKKEAAELALDETMARELAMYVIFETKNMAGKDWFNCNKKHNLDEQVALIKALE